MSTITITLEELVEVCEVLSKYWYDADARNALRNLSEKYDPEEDEIELKKGRG